MGQTAGDLTPCNGTLGIQNAGDVIEMMTKPGPSSKCRREARTKSVTSV